MNPRRAPRRLAAIGAGVLLTLSALAGSASAADGDGGGIAHVERTDTGFSVSVDVPAGSDVDLDAVTAEVDGTEYPATAERISDGGTDLERTTVLAIDTSNSMRGPRFRAAKRAATTFLDTVPDDVRVAIVAFARKPAAMLEPTTDRDAARAVIDDLSLSRGTSLYDGVVEAARWTGTTGQRTVLVLSDGADTDSVTTLPRLVDGLAAEDITIDVVALEQRPQQLAALSSIAGEGQVIEADRDSLTSAFADEADVLQRQVGVAIQAPADVVAGQATISVTVASASGDLTSSATVPASEDAVAEPAPAAPRAAPAPAAGAEVPSWVMGAGVAVFGVGLALALVLLVPAKPVPMSAAERVATYTAAPGGDTSTEGRPSAEAALSSAKDAMAAVLKRNRSLDDRIVKRLEAAGSQLRSSEWLLIHAGIFVLSGLLGLLVGGGSVGVGLIFLLLGVLLPWLFLGFKAGRRRKKFESALPDTLQLMAGSLSAGLSLAQSIDTITREGVDPVSSEFKRVLVETRIGVSIEDAFDGVADRFDSKDFAWVVMAIRIQRQVGGNLAELLDTVAETMREREYMRRQVGALAAEGKLSAIVLSAIPPLFLLYLVFTQPDYVDPLIHDPRGLLILFAGTAWLGVGVFWMSRLVKVEV